MKEKVTILIATVNFQECKITYLPAATHLVQNILEDTAFAELGSLFLQNHSLPRPFSNAVQILLLL